MLRLIAVFCLLASACLAQTVGVPAPTGTPLNAKNCGAVGDGVANDRPALQACLNQLQQTGGGTLTIPAGTYLLNSYSVSADGGFFYNLLVGSNIQIACQGGATLLQGASGRAPLPGGRMVVTNSVLVFGTVNYSVITFQNTNYNGGFYTLAATVAGSNQVTLSTPAQAANFHPGNYVSIYATTVGDVLPGEMSQVASANATTGVVTLTHNLARSFATPSIANVASLATSNSGISGCTSQGAQPLAVTEFFGWSGSGNHFTVDTSIGGSNNLGFNLDTVRGFSSIGDTWGYVSGSPGHIEMPQRDSQDVTISGDTFNAASVGISEYCAHVKITGSTFNITSSAAVSVSVQCLDALIDGNTISGGNVTAGAGLGSLFTDFNAPADYAPYIGQTVISNNTITCQADGNNCVSLGTSDPRFVNNHLTATGTANAIRLDSVLAQTAVVTGNTISIGTGNGLMVTGIDPDGQTISTNSITGTGSIGIDVLTPGSPHAGSDVIMCNTITGFSTAISIDLTKHPGAVVVPGPC